MLKVGTTKDEFATNYANASKENRGSAKWNSVFSEGQEVFSKYLDISEANDTIDENEFKMFEYMINFIKNLSTLE